MTSDSHNKTNIDNADTKVARLSSLRVSELLAIGLESDGNGRAELVAQLATLDDETATQVMEDLKTNLASNPAGPLSLRRLTGATPGVLQQIGEASIIELLTAETSSRDVLEVMVAWGDLLEEPALPLSTRCTGLLTETVARSALFARHGMQPTVESLSRIHDVFEAIEQNALIAAFIQGTR